MLVSRLLEVMSHLRQELFTLHETNWSFIHIIQWIVCKGDYDSKETWDTKWTTLNPTPVQTIEHAYTVALRYFAIWLQLNPFSRLNLLMLWPSPTHPLWLPLYASFPHYTECTIHPYTSINEAVVGMVVGIVDWVFPPTKWTVSIGSEAVISASVRTGSNAIISDVLYFFKLLTGYITFSSSHHRFYGTPTFKQKCWIWNNIDKNNPFFICSFLRTHLWWSIIPLIFPENLHTLTIPNLFQTEKKQKYKDTTIFTSTYNLAIITWNGYACRSSRMSRNKGHTIISFPSS